MYFNAGLLPWYLTIKSIGLQNNFLVYILPSAVSAFYVVLLKTFFEQLPDSLEESAMLDGANYFTLFMRICLPLSKPILATIALFAAVNQWNSWMDNFFFVTNDNMQTLQLILYRFLNQAQKVVSASGSVNEEAVKNISSRSIQTSITVIVTLPILFCYPFLQRYFVKGLLMGSIKG
jgi:ABC-type glycerol-3-phosphate transport system permease component